MTPWVSSPRRHCWRCLVFSFSRLAVHSALIEHGIVRSPYLISSFYLAFLIAVLPPAPSAGTPLPEVVLKSSSSAAAAALGPFFNQAD